MHPHTTLILTLTTLSAALTLTPHAPTHTFCIEPYTSYWQSGYKTVFFTHPAAPYNFSILTGYMRFYPPVLAAWLHEKGFHIANASALTPHDLCGWAPGEPVVRDGRRHGVISWKHTHTTDASLAAPRARPQRAARIPLAPAALAGAAHLPQDPLLDTVRAVLRDNTPDADRFYYLSLLLATACGSLVAALLFYGLAGLAALRARARSATLDKDQGVELEAVKVHALDDAVLRREGVVRTAVEAPPPVYSVDGAGR
ncbi:hypothetical protein C7974DRAFT_457639 [Boeremia exigua]|uniref:uncharacterized protein n=1 Tax=Boeremia exigua TaxID=749465 RepID=UPI001E8CCD14|nr:uncharacterized protein C7974DRAFT_457639 [Boeremia exigua]KAH6622439.1 hypothetical protein C7974DRAFT_457639 [Boeremia exigua]